MKYICDGISIFDQETGSAIYDDVTDLPAKRQKALVALHNKYKDMSWCLAWEIMSKVPLLTKQYTKACIAKGVELGLLTAKEVTGTGKEFQKI